MANITNFHCVTPWLYRGGQPSQEGLLQLADMGVKSIVSLRSGRIASRSEKQMANQLGMNFLHLPFTYFNIPDESQIAEFIEWLDEPAHRPLFVHCFHGSDRTGFMLALYRMTRMGWSVQQAYAEMKSFGFHSFRLPHFKWVLWDYARNLENAQGNNLSSRPVNRAGS